MKQHQSVAALIWGLLFILLALAGALLGFGVLPDLAALAFIGPLVLIGLGLIGLVLARKN